MGDFESSKPGNSGNLVEKEMNIDRTYTLRRPTDSNTRTAL